ncbi:hypothetical protein NMG60_11029821 [Bertholletia excelsa]
MANILESSSSKSSSKKDKTFEGFASLVKHLPTGTVFLFQFLEPVLTNNGHCRTINKYLSGILLVTCGLSCILSSFTDSYKGSDDRTHYALVTPSGLWPATAAESVDLKKYRLRIGDFVHAALSVAVFMVVALLDVNTQQCFYPSLASSEKTLIQALPPVIGTVSGAVFVKFPSTRHGIGYQRTTNSN